MSNFEQLLEQSKQLTTHIVSPIISIERGLEQIEQQTKRLLKRTSKQEAMDTRAAYLLANRGFDAERVKETIGQINLSLSFEPLQGVPDTDIDGYLRNEHENLVSVAIENQKSNTIADFEQHFERTVQKEWTRIKRKIMDEMGHQQADSMEGVQAVSYGLFAN